MLFTTPHLCYSLLHICVIYYSTSVLFTTPHLCYLLLHTSVLLTAHSALRICATKPPALPRLRCVCFSGEPTNVRRLGGFARADTAYRLCEVSAQQSMPKVGVCVHGLLNPSLSRPDQLLSVLWSKTRGTALRRCSGEFCSLFRLSLTLLLFVNCV